MKDANDTRNIAPRIGSPLWVFMTAVSVVGGGLLGLALLYLSRHYQMQGLFGDPMFGWSGG
ncbi:MAG TPA: hypothetical protein VN695_13460 [Streptosporangiaceae bacterium]|nr:hypothetical protein [Streptosporangiaceae bacterium]